ncbi:MAG TPA: hypothetical protein VE093_08635 [Polyangiaceae bacterium]|nr:hypothetical protein [Polyangiaceae bacterium]
MPRSGLSHAYPSQLAAFVLARVDELGARPAGLSLPEDAPAFESVLSVAYQASLLRDEDRPLTFRLAIAPEAAFDPSAGPPKGVHVLSFNAPRPFAVHELMKLVSAVKFQRSIVAAAILDDQLAVWGILHTGPRWLQTMRGGREGAPELPPVVIIHVNGPGNIVVSLGSLTLARLYAGEITIPMLDVFDSMWLPGMFSGVRGEIEEAFSRMVPAAAKRAVDMDIIRRVGQAFVRRIISTVRDARHGGSLLVVPPLRTADVCGGGLVTVKYVFKDAEPRRRFRTLILAVLRELSEQAIEAGRPIGWEEYASSHAPAIVELDEAIMEMAHLVSALADVDGLVVMTQRFEVLGFGGVVSGQLPEIAAIAQAINLEGTERIEEPTDGMGTRHRAAYRAVAAMPDALCVVISQDGGVRFVKWHEGGVTYWDQVAASAFGG